MSKDFFDANPFISSRCAHPQRRLLTHAIRTRWQIDRIFLAPHSVTIVFRRSVDRSHAGGIGRRGPIEALIWIGLVP
jgi:hypothetical protein